MGRDDQRLFPGDRDYRSVDPRRKHVRSGSLLWWRASDCGDAFATRSWPGGADVALGLHALIGCMAFGAITLVPVVPIGNVRRGKARSPSGRQTHPATFAPAGSNRSSRGGNEAAEAIDGKGHVGDSASPQAATCSES